MEVPHEDKMKMLEELAETLVPAGPRDDEFTTKDFTNSLKATGRNISASWARRLLADQVEEGKLEKRNIGGKNYYRVVK